MEIGGPDLMAWNFCWLGDDGVYHRGAVIAFGEYPFCPPKVFAQGRVSSNLCERIEAFTGGDWAAAITMSAAFLMLRPRMEKLSRRLMRQEVAPDKQRAPL